MICQRCGIEGDIPERIHLVNSSIFANLDSAYDGDPLRNVAIFQRQIVNSVIDNMMAKYTGKLIIHSHDWMAGGVITTCRVLPQTYREGGQSIFSCGQNLLHRGRGPSHSNSVLTPSNH
jgi:hypothetical protein